MYKNNSLFFALILFFGLGSITAQSFVGRLNPYPMEKESQNSTQTSLHILAVLAEFKPDQDDATFGDGTFGSIYTREYGNDILDPLPHDASYFEDHLLFVKNYYNKVSGGLVDINYTVIPGVITVSKTMRDYSTPINTPDDFSNLGNFSKEVWSIADQQNPDINFSDYDLFVIFHAGVGRDIDVPGSIGNDRDLPSVYLSTKALKTIYGDSFEGYPVDNGSFNITNTAILPETESREISGIGGDVLLELTINGLIVSTVASHMGLPDLFDTNTGLSAIGRFGLMDGQAIFAYLGLFPPEPSAWERVFLGWEEPVTISQNQSVSITSRISADETDTTLVKIPINSTEYFLIENRKRDAKSDGAVITYKLGNEIFTKTFPYDTETFSFFNVDTINGVVIDVDEFDWAMPGDDRNTVEGEFKDIGLQIWHIDEKVIREKLNENKINTDKFNRGVRLVEADGIYDIGEEFQDIFGDVVIGEGSKEDTWFASNPAEFYSNTFNDNSRPSAKANSGANSLIEINNFSEVSSRMSFKVTFGGDRIKPVNRFTVPSEGNIKWIEATNSSTGMEIYVFENDSYSVYSEDGTLLKTIHAHQVNKPAVLALENLSFVAGVKDSGLHVDKIEGIARTILNKDEDVILTSPPIFESYDENQILITVGTEYGYVNTYQIQLNLEYQIGTFRSIKVLNEAVTQVATDGNFFAAIGNTSYNDMNEILIEFTKSPKQLVLTKDQDGNYISIIGFEDNSYKTISNGKVIAEYSSNSNQFDGFSVSDLRGNNSNYVVFSEDGLLSAINILGSTAENFPIEDKYESNFIGRSLSADVDGDGFGDVLGFTEDGKIVGLSGLTGEVISDFPISFGSELAAAPVLLSNETTKLIIADKESTVSVWEISSSYGTIYWSGDFGNSLNQSFVEAPKGENASQDYFPKSKAYNWPNPVYEGKTFFRYYVSEDSKVEINIFDLAGDYVAKLKGDGVGGLDNEVAWDVSDIESGVYLAHLKTTSNSSGKTDFKIIKVAVIK